MIIPVRCFTCGAVIGDKYQEYMALIHEMGNTEEEAMTALGLSRFCCRRMFLTHCDFSDQLIKFNPADNAVPTAHLAGSQ